MKYVIIDREKGEVIAWFKNRLERNIAVCGLQEHIIGKLKYVGKDDDKSGCVSKYDMCDVEEIDGSSM